MLTNKPNIILNLTSTSFADQINLTAANFPVGFRYWPSGEIGAYKQPTFHVGFRQYSSRVQDYEYLNRADGGEGEEGWYLSYGFTNILRADGRGSWYSKEGNRSMLPNIDMEHLPGTTVRVGSYPLNPKFVF